MKLLGVSGTIVGSKTAVVVNTTLNQIKEKNPNIEIDCMDLSNYNMEFSDGRPTEQYNECTQEIITKMLEADFYLLGTPVFNGSIPAPLKNLFDLIPPMALRYKVIGIVANGGTYQHHLMVENQLKPITGYLRAFTTPSYVYAQNSHFDANNKIVDLELLERISNLADEMLLMQSKLGKGSMIKEEKSTSQPDVPSIYNVETRRLISG